MEAPRSSLDFGGGKQCAVRDTSPARAATREHQSLFHMALYDEDVLKNPFYLSLGKQRPDLCSWVAERNGIFLPRVSSFDLLVHCHNYQLSDPGSTVLVPRCGSLHTRCFPPGCFEDHILQAVDGGYRTCCGKEVLIEDRLVKLGEGFPVPAAVPVLFEETFYNEREQSYSILCIAGPISTVHSGVNLVGRFSQSPATPYYGPVLSSPTRVSHPTAQPALVSMVCRLKDAEDVRDFLGQHAEKLDELIGAFCRAFREQEKKGLQYHIRALAKQELQMMLLKQAVEIYVHHGIHDFIFQYVGTTEASQDAVFNKTTRSLQDLQQKDLGIKSEFSANIPRAKRELSQLNHCTSPLQKLLCLRKVALVVMQPPSGTVNLGAMCADDLLSVLLYLLLKTEIPNWVANLSYIKNFHLFHSAEEELSYCLTSFEAAVEYISQGHLNQALMLQDSGELEHRAFFRPYMSLVSHSASSPLDCLFEHIARGNEAEVRRLLSKAEASDGALRMCHPLCSCERCEHWLSGRSSDPSVVTPSSQDDRGYTPLHVAAVCGQPLLIDLLISKGAQINATDYHGLTPLHLSCQKGFQDVTLLLLHHKADRDVQDSNGNTPLHFACVHGHEDCVKALVHYDLPSSRLEIQNDKGDTPLHIAARWGYDAIIKVLLENGANTAAQNKAKDTPLKCALNSKVERLHRAVADGDVQMVRYLLEWMDEESGDEEPPQPQSDLCHPLCQCPHCHPTQKPASLPGGGLDVNSSNPDGVTPLHVAAQHGHASLVRLLAQRGAGVNARNSQSATPLHLACQNGHCQVGVSPAHSPRPQLRACFHSNPSSVVTSLLEFNPKLNTKDQHGNTALMFACLRGHMDAVAILLQGGAAVNTANNQGNTALHLAVEGGHRGLVDRLLQAGASVHLRNSRNRTPLDQAQEMDGKVAKALQLTFSN
ncbi:ankyrin repeat domain-containing protein 27-like [Scleropages formosus]|uniref:Ankyrin repeat domain-containing protein 27-like n=1 Tax=Scleropages formosus TaxID=113540 RepID=A0A0P7VCU4_SCLFO|nr:ankyrin repeat domain-containing protein 27-like [Scleropages formosus]